ncbi:hypothetical protein [Paracraurococcus ruber]|uniref:hypothetical protein n=1 Tax=Paracraurococcus ruber TaxID=77675 RepID=UPI001057FDE9|nr:hypothetical protein [Paracraurococcus ruber]
MKVIGAVAEWSRQQSGAWNRQRVQQWKSSGDRALSGPVSGLPRSAQAAGFPAGHAPVLLPDADLVRAIGNVRQGYYQLRGPWAE